MAFAAFLISAILLGATCVAVARLAQAWADRFWLLIAAFLLQLGFITSILSPLYALTGRNWLRVQAIVLLPIAVVIYIWRPRRAGVTASRPASASSRSKTFLLAILLIAAMIAISGVEKFLLPVSNIDDRNYYASRAAYWIQNQSALHYSTHNDRQVMFPISAQLPFFWPLLFTRAEAPAQFVYWLAYPLLALAMYALLREMNQSSTVAAVGAMLLCLTPQVVLTTRGAHNEHWVTLCTLGCAFWCVRAWRNQGTAPLDFILAALFATLAAAQRITAIPLLPAVLLLPFLVGASRGKLRALATMSLTIVIAIACSGWLLTIVENTRHFGHPLGPSAIRARHSPDYSKRTIATHLARFVLVLLDPPALPTASLRDAYARGATKVLEASNTAKSLRYETLQDDWPGPYIVRPTPFAEFYSLPGLAILPALCAAIFLAMRDIRATSPHMRLRPVSLLALLAIPFFIAVVFGIRWMGLMGGFWVAPYALTLAIVVSFAAALQARHRSIRILCMACVIITVSLSALSSVLALIDVLSHDVDPIALDEPYAEPLLRMHDGSTILLVAGQATRDYPLFRPRAGFINRVIPWGEHPFDNERLNRIIQSEQIRFVVIEDDRQIDFLWNPPVWTLGFVRALSADPRFQEVKLEYTPHMRLYERR